MPTFGQYETAQRLFLSGVSGIYALKSDDKRVIKVLHPPVGIWSEERVQEEIDGFRQRVKTQKAVAGASKNWAPIHDTAAIRDAESEAGSGGAAIESGMGGVSEAAGAYAVMDRYERSVQSLLDGRVILHNADLRALFTGIIQGLLDLRQTVSRPHGAFKASNILLSQSVDLATATVHLSDPAPNGALTAASAAKDLAQLGRILYHLVNRRPYDEGTLSRNKDWDALGPNGEDWRKLCGALLDPPAHGDECDLDNILARIQSWTAKPKQGRKPLLYAAAALVLLVAGIMAYVEFRPKPVIFSSDTWQNEALAYYSWFYDFAAHVKPIPEGEKDNYPEGYSDIVTRITNANESKNADRRMNANDIYSPVKIAGKSASISLQPTADEWKDLIVKPPEAITEQAGIKSTAAGWQLIEDVTKALNNWKVRTDLNNAAQSYKQDERGWQKPADELNAVFNSLSAPSLYPGDPIEARFNNVDKDKKNRVETLFQSIEIAIAAHKLVYGYDTDAPNAPNAPKTHANGIKDRWDRIIKLPAHGVPLLEKLPDFAKAYTAEALNNAQANPGDPLSNLRALAGFLQKFEEEDFYKTITSAVNKQDVNFAELARDDAARDASPLTVDKYKALAEAVQWYVKIDDPRVKVKTQWDADFRQEVQPDMRDYLALAAPTSDEVKKQLDEINALVKKLNDMLAPDSGIALIEKNREKLKALADEAGTLATNIHQAAVRYSDPLKITPEQYVNTKRQYVPSRPFVTPAVYQRWKTDREKLLTEAIKKNLKDFDTRRSVDNKLESLEKAYQAIDAAIPVKIPVLSDIAGTDWRHQIADRVATVYREDALQELMSNHPAPPDDIPQITEADLVDCRKKFDGTCAAAAALINDYTALAGCLDQLYLRNDEPSPGNSWSDLYKKWGGAPQPNPLLKDSVISGALNFITLRVKALQDIESIREPVSLQDYQNRLLKPLLNQAQTLDPEIALAAWRKLGTAALTEDTPALDNEDQAEAALQARLNASVNAKVLSDSRLRKITAEIDGQRPVRWHLWADVLTGAAAIQTALDKIDAFHVSLNPQADAALVYDRAYYALLKEFTKGHAEAELKPLADAFRVEVRKMPAAVSGEPGVRDLLDRIDKSLSPNQGESSTNGAGPQLAKWEMDASHEGLRVFYLPSKTNPKFTLEFQKMAVNEANAQKTVYLCTTEMSIGLFIQIMNTQLEDKRYPINVVDNGKFPSVNRHWIEVPASPFEDRHPEWGVRTWFIDNGKFALRTEWLDDVGAKMGVKPNVKPYFPPDATPRPPAADDPLQLISPWAAMYAAQLLGCRLPTSAEWKAAYELFEAQNVLPKDVWNLRGEGPAGRATWRTQQDYANINAINDLPYPDQNVFLPASLLFSKIQGSAAKPWTADALAKMAPARIAPGPPGQPYQNNTLCFLPVDKEVDKNGQPVAPRPTMHHLVGNVAEYVFDGDNATDVVKSNQPDPAAIDAILAPLQIKKLCVIGGSALSPPEIPFNVEQPINPNPTVHKYGFSDVGVRLAYTAPIDSIQDVLANTFRERKYLPGPKAKG